MTDVMFYGDLHEAPDLCMTVEPDRIMAHSHSAEADACLAEFERQPMDTIGAVAIQHGTEVGTEHILEYRCLDLLVKTLRSYEPKLAVQVYLNDAIQPPPACLTPSILEANRPLEELYRPQPERN